MIQGLDPRAGQSVPLRRGQLVQWLDSCADCPEANYFNIDSRADRAEANYFNIDSRADCTKAN